MRILPTNNPNLTFLRQYDTIPQILKDKDLAALGDAYINLVHSLALSNQSGRPCGKKVKGTALAEALRKAGLRTLLPSRMDSHDLSDAAEALLAYAWLHTLVSLEENVNTLSNSDNLVSGLTKLLINSKEKISLSKLSPVPC